MTRKTVDIPAGQQGGKLTQTILHAAVTEAVIVTTSDAHRQIVEQHARKMDVPVTVRVVGEKAGRK